MRHLTVACLALVFACAGHLSAQGVAVNDMPVPHPSDPASSACVARGLRLPSSPVGASGDAGALGAVLASELSCMFLLAPEIDSTDVCVPVSTTIGGAFAAAFDSTLDLRVGKIRAVRDNASTIRAISVASLRIAFNIASITVTISGGGSAPGAKSYTDIFEYSFERRAGVWQYVSGRGRLFADGGARDEFRTRPRPPRC